MEHEEAAPHAAPVLTVVVVDEELEGAQLSNEESELVEAHRRHCEHIRAVRHPLHSKLQFSSPLLEVVYRHRPLDNRLQYVRIPSCSVP